MPVVLAILGLVGRPAAGKMPHRLASRSETRVVRRPALSLSPDDCICPAAATRAGERFGDEAIA
jgi:hypothetical protein